ncbi:MAG: hypothetical protein DM484_28430 [Candidatus Methylumidiphilus alinenensis]|uniref:Uncharacterized protein n=1 Tax=Candidatus Methylumidiphilus alinenensis TaxID=2202197 RepID=A0A2W4S9E9_9GAMM|nr:MAG: hypothetical protein DM484_28430 [Candidatus Methylumidiphilus alinenensis]
MEFEIMPGVQGLPCLCRTGFVIPSAKFCTIAGRVDACTKRPGRDCKSRPASNENCCYLTRMRRLLESAKIETATHSGI